MLMVGSWLAKRVMAYMTAEQFTGLMDGVLLLAGLLVLAGAIWT
jgi:hypothetical protein